MQKKYENLIMQHFCCLKLLFNLNKAGDYNSPSILTILLPLTNKQDLQNPIVINKIVVKQ